VDAPRLWVNGSLVEAGAAAVRADDHGVVVGDGVFETCQVRDGRAFALTRHLSRLRHSADGLGLRYDESMVRDGVAAVLRGVTGNAKLRITATGGPSPYGSDRGTAPASVLVATSPLHDWPATTDLVVVPWTRNERAATAGLKTTSYADNVVALAHAKERGAAEAVFANSRDELCEGTGSNVFIGSAGRLVTPPLSSGCLAGITRELLLEWLGDVVEDALPVDALAAADEAFITSSTRDVQPVRAVDGRALPAAPGPLTERAMRVFACGRTDPDP
jgi:branched-chain amino acid aminotransferase